MRYSLMLYVPADCGDCQARSTLPAAAPGCALRFCGAEGASAGAVEASLESGHSTLLTADTS